MKEVLGEDHFYHEEVRGWTIDLDVAYNRLNRVGTSFTSLSLRPIEDWDPT